MSKSNLKCINDLYCTKLNNLHFTNGLYANMFLRLNKSAIWSLYKNQFQNISFSTNTYENYNYVTGLLTNFNRGFLKFKVGKQKKNVYSSVEEFSGSIPKRFLFKKKKIRKSRKISITLKFSSWYNTLKKRAKLISLKSKRPVVNRNKRRSNLLKNRKWSHRWDWQLLPFITTSKFKTHEFFFFQKIFMTF